MGIATLVKKILPDTFLVLFNRIRQRSLWSNYKELTTKEVFTKIYNERVWGTDQSNPAAYFSGGGSHEAALIDPYVTAIQAFITNLKTKPDVMDLGCGDFNIGSKVRHLCNRYIACDIVDTLIEHNKSTFKNMEVDFRVVDLTNEKCETVDIIFVRQVLQHLSNDDIQKGLKNMVPFCKYLIVTEHWPTKSNFKKNVDKPTGPDTRTLLYSGIDITAAPFNYSDLQATCICEVPDAFGTIKTFVYQRK